MEGDAIVDDLKNAIKLQRANALFDIDAAELNVFAVGACVDPNANAEDPLDPGDDIPSGTTSKKPLVITLPQQQQNGKLHCCLCILVFSLFFK